MMVVSYLIGQSFYKIKYDLPRILGYLGLAILSFKISEWINLEGILKYGINTMLFLAFTAIIALTMRKKQLSGPDLL